MIAPTFESLSTKFSKPGKITFCKVNVDNQQSIASSHQVTAMPTFIIFKGSSELQRVRGADSRSLTDAVEKAVKLAATAAPGASFQTPGRTLGGGGGGGGGAAAVAPSRASGAGGRALGGSGGRSRFDLFGFFNAILTFFGLYAVSLISVCVMCIPAVAIGICMYTCYSISYSIYVIIIGCGGHVFFSFSNFNLLSVRPLQVGGGLGLQRQPAPGGASAYSSTRAECAS